MPCAHRRSSANAEGTPLPRSAHSPKNYFRSHLTFSLTAVAASRSFAVAAHTKKPYHGSSGRADYRKFRSALGPGSPNRYSNNSAVWPYIVNPMRDGGTIQ